MTFELVQSVKPFLQNVPPVVLERHLDLHSYNAIALYPYFAFIGFLSTSLPVSHWSNSLSGRPWWWSMQTVVQC
jgi:ABC-type transport system involved in cytochrome c biogenesis permease subunit